MQLYTFVARTPDAQAPLVFRAPNRTAVLDELARRVRGFIDDSDTACRTIQELYLWTYYATYVAAAGCAFKSYVNQYDEPEAMAPVRAYERDNPPQFHIIDPGLVTGALMSDITEVAQPEMKNVGDIECRCFTEGENAATFRLDECTPVQLAE